MRFIANPDNPGFAVACNQGAAASDAPWLAFVNPDLMVERDTLAQLCARAAGHAAVLLGVEQVDEHGQPDAAVRRRDPDFAAMLRAPRAAAFVVPAWNDALLFVEREGLKETHQLGVWLSLYGVPESSAAPLRTGLADLQSALSVAEG